MECQAATSDNGLLIELFDPANGEKLINYHPHFQWRGLEMTLGYQPECEIQIVNIKPI